VGATIPGGNGGIGTAGGDGIGGSENWGSAVKLLLVESPAKVFMFLFVFAVAFVFVCHCSD